MLTLLEDETYIKECYKTYLSDTSITDWKYEHAIKHIIELGFQPIEQESDLKKLGAIYKSLVNDMKAEYSTTYRARFNCGAYQKAPSRTKNGEQTIYKPLKTVFLMQKRSHITRRRAKEMRGEQKTEKKTERKGIKGLLKKKFDKLSSSEKYAHFAKYYDEVLGLQKPSIPRRFQKHMRKMKEDVGIILQPLVTLEERDMLLEIAKCQNESKVENLLTAWYNKKDLPSNCKFIRFALAAGLEIWHSKALTKSGHREDWYRLHLYSNVWDKTF